MNSKRSRLMVGLLLTLFASGALFTWWTVQKTDQKMRAVLLQQGQLVAQAVNIENVHALKGTEADINSPVYQRLKEQLGILRAASPLCRFIYLLGSKADASLFFFVDSEPVDSKDCSPPGQVYDEAPEGFRRVFATRTAAAEGPYTDRWGKWITALVPILDPQTAMYGLATPKDAQAMVVKAVEFYRKNGRERLLQAVNDPSGEFHKGDLYVFIYDRNMTWLAHPVKPELVGQNWIDKKDWSGGKYFRREIQEVARAKGNGWVEFEYLNPINGQQDHKTTYVEGLDDLIICSGAYKGNGEIRAVLGMDIDARDWSRMLVMAALPPVLFTLALELILLISSVLLARRSRIASEPPRWMRHLEPAIVTATGLVLTLLAAWMLHEREAHNRNEAFKQLAASRTEAIADTLRDIGTIEIEGLARFHENRITVSPEEFLQYTGYLTKDSAVQAWEWCAVVPAADKPRFEAVGRATGQNGFAIWQKDAQGKPVPAADRAVFYPVALIAPLSGNERVLGYDLGSEPLRRAALETAMRTGLTTATDPITLVQEIGAQKGLLVYRPVFAGDDPHPLAGFAVAALRIGALLWRATPDSSAVIEISLLRQGTEPELLATTKSSDNRLVEGLSMTRPVFAFGKVFAVAAHAGPEFMRLYPMRAGGLAVLSGTWLTAAFAVVISVVLRRRQELERLVFKRTNELKESEQAYRDQFARNSAVMILMDPKDGAIIDANDTAARFYGFSREKLLTMSIVDINPMPISEILQEYATIRQEQGQRFLRRHRLSDGSMRDVEVSASRIQFGSRVVVHTIVYDITERTRAEEERAKMTRQLEGLNILGELLLELAPLETKLSGITNGIVHYFHADFCRIWLIRPGDLCAQGCVHAMAVEGSSVCQKWDKCLHLLASSGRYTRTDDKECGRMPFGCSKIGRIASGDEHKLLSNDLANDPDVQDRDWARELGIVSFAGYQLRVPGGELIGVLGLYSQQPIPPAEDAMLDGLSSAVALTVQQAAVEAALKRANDELELRVEHRTGELTQANEIMRNEIVERQKAQAERETIEEQLRHAQKLEAIGQLAAGIAHEINTPTQFVSDNTHFVQQAFQTIKDVRVLEIEMLEAAKTNSVTPELIARIEQAAATGDLDYLFKEIPDAIDQTLEGVERIAKIVRAMKEFSHPGSKEQAPANLNKAIESTSTVAHSEWKYVADLNLDLDPNLPQVVCFVSDFNQAILNLIVNASHAIGDVIKQKPGTKGAITVSTRQDGQMVEVRVGDTGAGIPEAIRSRMFEPFFTTKGVGKGTGQGLAMVYSVIVKRHGGTVTFESEVGKGTTFILRFPIAPLSVAKEGKA